MTSENVPRSCYGNAVREDGYEGDPDVSAVRDKVEPRQNPPRYRRTRPMLDGEKGLMTQNPSGWRFPTACTMRDTGYVRRG